MRVGIFTSTVRQGLGRGLTSLRADIPIQLCTMHKLRNLIAHAPKKQAEDRG
jgi:transposase-like protein